MRSVFLLQALSKLRVHIKPEFRRLSSLSRPVESSVSPGAEFGGRLWSNDHLFPSKAIYLAKATLRAVNFSGTRPGSLPEP